MDLNPVYPVLPNWPIDNDIYTGFWVNRSRGKFQAATITLDQRMWNLFIAFIALFVGATARSIWKLVRFAVHLAHSTHTNEDGVHHQRQAVLRNTSLATDAVLQAIQIGLVWRGRAAGRIGRRLRALSLLGVAAAVSLLTTAASFLSSELFNSPPSEVLIAGRYCGTLPFGWPPNPLAQLGRWTEYTTLKSWEDYSYAAQCYRNNTDIGCDKFVYPALPYTSDRHALCPFAPEMCKLSYGNLLLDTGDIDSVKHLGLNKGPRFTLRYRTHCAPLVTEGFTFPVPMQNTTRKFIDYKYGTPRDGTKSMFMIENDDQRIRLPGKTYRTSYVDHNTMNLIPQLTVPGSLVSLIFLDANSILYAFKTDDPWFSATTPESKLGPNANISDASGEEGFYFADEPVGVLGCSTQRFICNPNMPNAECTNFMGQNKSIFAIQKAWSDPQDQQRIHPIVEGAIKGQVNSIYNIPGAPVLLARNTMGSNVQTAKLPSNQWQLESEHVFTATLAALQSSIVEYARGSWYGSLMCNADFPCEQMCHSQRVRVNNFHSFSTWTLVILLMAGIIIMLVALYLEELFDLAFQHTPLGKHARLRRGHAEWKAGSTLQLQRIAHENLGLGTWSRTAESVPVTNTGDVLGTYNIDDESHARLVNVNAEKKVQIIDGNISNGDTPNEEITEAAALGSEVASLSSERGRYYRVPNNEYPSA